MNVVTIRYVMVYTKGQTVLAMIDEADWPLVQGYKWYLSKGYAVAARRGTTISMHREILSPPPGFVTDHINGDRLDNRRTNLRPATAGQNVVNSKRQLRSPWGAKGVSRNRFGWFAMSSKGAMRIRRGPFQTKEEAAATYWEIAKLLHDPEFIRVQPSDANMVHWNPTLVGKDLPAAT